MAEPNQIPLRQWTSKGWLVWNPDEGYFELEKRSGTQEAIENLIRKPTVTGKSGTQEAIEAVTQRPSLTTEPEYSPTPGQLPITGGVRPANWPSTDRFSKIKEIRDKYLGGILGGQNLPSNTQHLSSELSGTVNTGWPQQDTSLATKELGPMPQVQTTGREPWQMAAEQQQYEANRRKAMYSDALLGISGSEKGLPDDLMTPQERMYIEDKIGLKLPQGFKRSQFQQTFGRGTAMGMTPYQQMMADLSERRMDQSERRLAQSEERESRLGTQFEEKFRRLPPDGQKEVASLSQANDQIDNLISKFDEYRSRVGPITGTANQLLQKIGMSDATIQQLVGEINDATGTYIKSKAGSRFSDQDLAFFRAGMPALNQNAEQFMGALQGYKERLMRGANSAKRAYGALGYDPSAFDMAVRQAPQTQGATQAQQPQMATGGLNVPQQGGGVEVQLQDTSGRVKKVTMNPEQAAQYQPPKGWTRIK